MCLEIYGLDPTHYLPTPGLAWQAALKKTKIKLALLTNIHILLMAKKGIRGVIHHAFHQYAKANNKCMKDNNESKEFSNLKY